MKIEGDAKLLRIFIGETDKISHIPVFEKIVSEARKLNLAGATVYRGILGFGGNSRVHNAKFLELSNDLPLVIEIVDQQSRIEEFIPYVQNLFEEANCGGLITLEKAEIIIYRTNKK
jgi:uncharacterized protein